MDIKKELEDVRKAKAWFDRRYPNVEAVVETPGMMVAEACGMARRYDSIIIHMADVMLETVKVSKLALDAKCIENATCEECITKWICVETDRDRWIGDARKVILKVAKIVEAVKG